MKFMVFRSRECVGLEYIRYMAFWKITFIHFATGRSDAWQHAGSEACITVAPTCNSAYNGRRATVEGEGVRGGVPWWDAHFLR